MSIIKVSSQIELDEAINRAFDNDEIHIVGNGEFIVNGSSRVNANDSSSVYAYDSSSVYAYDSSRVKAGKYVSVHVHSQSTSVEGGVRIDIPEITNARVWCEYNGADIDDEGVVILFKAVDDKFRSGRKFSYEPGTTPEAPDWDDGIRECGGGLHFCARPSEAASFFPEATRFVACPVRLDEIAFHKEAVYPTKVKAPRVCAPIWEVDIHGERVS